MKTCWSCCKRLSYLNILFIPRDSDRNIEVCYCPGHEKYIHYSLDNYGKIMKLADSYEFSKDRIYKFTLHYKNGFNVKKIYSKPRESHRNQKEIILKNKELYIELTGPTLYEYNTVTLIHQESINSDITISIPNIQDSEHYKNRCYLVRSDLFVRPLYDINSFFHDISAPNKCGDLKVSRKGDSILWTISKKNIKQLVFRFMITNAMILPLSLLLFVYLTDYSIDSISTDNIQLLMLFLDSVSLSCISLFASDYFTNRYRRVSTESFKFLAKIGIGSFFLKLVISFIFPFLSPVDTASPFRLSLQFTIPYIFSLFTTIVSCSCLAQTSFWYARSCDWFYNLRKKESALGRVFNKCLSWITNLSSLKGVDNDTEERCVVN
ncbi:predicted protein [Naegleria gruberi]|uniref:Predicted protein n=1 Tax=Naegleria gruberi TaxID=5762 RepID=D2VT15_NAEGR|nr:uncharacterized protein NAEGRDRAFT_72138 [Naegleria gruberi]EFC40004.1 predicted protein [Naegleria gruberi]|eukprot:XP_002672748.1 predicted protein [Naegleria gruberi strain NEG-M]